MAGKVCTGSWSSWELNQTSHQNPQTSEVFKISEVLSLVINMSTGKDALAKETRFFLFNKIGNIKRFTLR